MHGTLDLAAQYTWLMDEWVPHFFQCQEDAGVDIFRSVFVPRLLFPFPFCASQMHVTFDELLCAMSVKIMRFLRSVRCQQREQVGACLKDDNNQESMCLKYKYKIYFDNK